VRSPAALQPPAKAKIAAARRERSGIQVLSAKHPPVDDYRALPLQPVTCARRTAIQAESIDCVGRGKYVSELQDQKPPRTYRAWASELHQARPSQ